MKVQICQWCEVTTRPTLYANDTISTQHGRLCITIIIIYYYMKAALKHKIHSKKE